MITINVPITTDIKVIEFKFSAENTDQINSDFFRVYIMEEKANVILAYDESGTSDNTVFSTETIVLEDMTA